jgi:hypothetical protein
MFARGEPAFVDALRRIDDAEALGAFAPRWLADTRPEARAMLLDYLDRPLNAFRHEALVKRLFKLAEAAGDDALMARFLVLTDRSIRRDRVHRIRRETREVGDEKAANALADALRARGFASVGVRRNWRQNYRVWGDRLEPRVTTPRDTTMPRDTLKKAIDPYSLVRRAGRSRTFSVPDWVFALRLDPRSFREGDPFPEARRKELEGRRLFSLATRRYLRRRAWRYFRGLGRRHPDRYVAGVTRALAAYRDDDASDGLELIDNWALIHILFHFSPVLACGERGWRVAPGRSLAELEPAPMFPALWQAAPRAAVELLAGARCRAVRVWAVRWIRRDPAAAAAVFPLEERLDLLGHDDPEVAGLAADLLRDAPGLEAISPGRWVDLVQTARPAAPEVLGALMERHVAPGQVSMADAVRLAGSRPLPLARLGLRWLRTMSPRDEAECRLLLRLVEAACEALRPEIAAWARGVLSSPERFRPEWVLGWLDSRHPDVRAEGWRWFRAEPGVRDDAAAWLRLMETPYDDVRLALVGELESRTREGPGVGIERGGLDPERLARLWGAVLRRVRGAGRAKPVVVRQVLRRLESHPDDLPLLLPLLAVALRSVRGPEWRAGLAAVVQLAGRDEATAAQVLRAFPELKLASGVEEPR